MQFAASALLLAGASFFSTASAAGVFSILGSGIPGSNVTLYVDNGAVGDPPTCNGTVKIGPLPVSGTIPCQQGYALAFNWNSVQQGGVSANYSTPTSAPFTYNLPINGNDGTTYDFGFTDNFKVAREFSA